MKRSLKDPKSHPRPESPNRVDLARTPRFKKTCRGLDVSPSDNAFMNKCGPIAEKTAQGDFYEKL
jgi:hypothetical protein